MENEPNKPHHEASAIGLAMTVVAWLLLLGMLALYFQDVLITHVNPNRNPEMVQIDDRSSLVLNANRQQHFVLTGKVNGVDTALLIDTGATRVAVPADIAHSLHLRPGKKGLSYTANGPVETYQTTIAMLELGEITLTNVDAEINPGMNGIGKILLGMSALSQIEFSQRNGQLILRQ
tara:strand:- start:317 stop:847 length:531 start_codon:yes stop_codon:yes gene_type:complete